MHEYDVGNGDPARTRSTPAADEHELAAEVGRALSAGEAGHLGAEAVLHLQRSAGNAGVVQLLGDEQDEAQSPVRDVVGRGGGRPLEDAVRTEMEGRFGVDFGGVRVHADGQAAESARTVNAHAYTVGDDIVFGSGRYDPASPTGQRTIAHELTHVIQQRSGPVDGTPAAGGIQLSNPADRFEQAAERNAERIMSAEPGSDAEDSSVQALALQALSVQRDGEEGEDDEVQALAVQRDGEEEEEEADAG